MNFRSLQVVLLFCASVIAGPGGHLELVNLTPYDWELTYKHSYQMQWRPTDFIPAGSRHEQYAEYRGWQWGDHGDNGAEATYRMKGTEYEFQVQARQDNGKRIQIQYNEALAEKTMTREKVIDLGFDHDGSVLFVLSGNGIEPYVSSQAPRNWMQATLPTIGDKEIREVSMPMSHNSGMYTVSYKYLGIKHNTLCQTHGIYDQLSYGTRWFDLRPAFAHHKWLTVHASRLGGDGRYVGTTGANFKDIVKDINRFTAETPGELIVLEIGHELDAQDSGALHPLRDGLPPKRWQEFYTLLEGINDLWKPSDPSLPEDLTTATISNFIQPGSRSAVIVRLPGAAPLPESGNPAFVYEARLPWTGDWVETSKPAVLDTKLTDKLNEARTSANSTLFRFAYNITPRVKDLLDIGNPLHSIVGESMWAEHELYQTIWDKLTPNTYPNLIEMDNIHNSQITAISMVINQRYASSIKKRDGVKENEVMTKYSPREHLILATLEDMKTQEALEKLQEILFSAGYGVLSQNGSQLEPLYANQTIVDDADYDAIEDDLEDQAPEGESED